MLEFFAGTLVGGFVGVVTMCLCITAGESDRSRLTMMFYTGNQIFTKSHYKTSLCGGFLCLSVWTNTPLCTIIVLTCTLASKNAKHKVKAHMK